MSLQVAPCPSCQAAVVYGERHCRTCGQGFDYGAAPPAVPTTEQVIGALRAVGVLVDAQPAPVSADDDSIFAAVAEAAAAVRPSMGSGGEPTTGGVSTSASSTLEFETGRYDGAGVVDVGHLPGLVDSTLFASMTAEHVDVDALAGLESTAFGGVDASSSVVGRLADLETAADVGAVAIDDVPGIYHSDLFHTDVDVAAGANAAGELLEVSPSAPRRERRSTSTTNVTLARAQCPACGTVHAAPRCPNCATVHPHEPTL
jgi:hypothetical protein